MDTSPSEVFVEKIPPRARDPFWSYIDLLIVIGLSFASFMLLGTVAATIATAFPQIRKNTGVALLLQMAMYGLVYLAFRATFQLRYEKPVLTSLGWKAVPFNPVVTMAGGAALAFFVAALASLLHTPAVPSPFDAMMGSVSAVVFLGIVAVVIAPMSEELVFRGFLQPLFSRTFGAGVGILITSVVFGLLHGKEYSWAWQYIVAISVAGLVFGWIRLRTKSVIPSMLMHGCYNAVFFVALIISKHAKP
jgi:membrane protease YdiL (CAAX protease family)